MVSRFEQIHIQQLPSRDERSICSVLYIARQ